MDLSDISDEEAGQGTTTHTDRCDQGMTAQNTKGMTSQNCEGMTSQTEAGTPYLNDGTVVTPLPSGDALKEISPPWPMSCNKWAMLR